MNARHQISPPCPAHDVATQHTPAQTPTNVFFFSYFFPFRPHFYLFLTLPTFFFIS